MVRLHRRADGSRLFVALALDWFNRDGENGKVGDVSKLTQRPRASVVSGDGGKPQVHRRHFLAAWLRPRLSNYRRPPTPVNWLGN